MTTFAELPEADQAQLRRRLAGEARPDLLRAPMGLPIGSHTAEEIAVSIAAEMVAVRHAISGSEE